MNKTDDSSLLNMATLKPISQEAVYSLPRQAVACERRQQQRYSVWVSPHMPKQEAREPEAIYMPQLYRKDKRLNYLDKEIYMSLYMVAQLHPDVTCDTNMLIKEIKTHPDKDEAILDEYLLKTGKKVDDLTEKEWKQLPTVPLTAEDVEDSLAKLEKLGYVKKLEE